MVKRISRVAVPAIMLVLVGVAVGPHVHVLFWSALLDRYPDTGVKFKACLRLGESEIGKDSLRNRLTSSNSVVRDLSVNTLASVEKPQAVAFLFGEVPEAYTDERIQILRGLEEFSNQYYWVMASLHYELKNKRNSPRVRTEILKVLRSIKAAESRISGDKGD